MARVHYVRSPVALFRLHESSKTIGEGAAQSAERPRRAAHRYWPASLRADGRLALAAMEILLAEGYLTVHNRDPKRAFAHLRNAFAADRRVAKWLRFWLLGIKGTLPTALLHRVRVWMKTA
jgi:hypothetical protein